jgi:hypothetical protein
VRVLLAGWFSFLDGEVTAGDVLALEAVRRSLGEARIGYEVAWSPAFRPDGPASGIGGWPASGRGRRPERAPRTCGYFPPASHQSPRICGC